MEGSILNSEVCLQDMRTKAEWRELKAFDLLVLSWRLQCALGLGDWRSFLCFSKVSHCRVARQKPAIASPHQPEPLKTRSRPLVGSSGLWNLSAASATQKAGSVASRKQADAHCTERAPKAQGHSETNRHKLSPDFRCVPTETTFSETSKH